MLTSRCGLGPELGGQNLATASSAQLLTLEHATRAGLCSMARKKPKAVKRFATSRMHFPAASNVVLAVSLLTCTQVACRKAVLPVLIAQKQGCNEEGKVHPKERLRMLCGDAAHRLQPSLAMACKSSMSLNLLVLRIPPYMIPPQHRSLLRVSPESQKSGPGKNGEAKAHHEAAPSLSSALRGRSALAPRSRMAPKPPTLNPESKTPKS